MNPDSAASGVRQFVTGIGDELGAHFLDPAKRRLIVNVMRMQYSVPPNAVGSRSRRCTITSIQRSIRTRDQHMLRAAVRGSRSAGRQSGDNLRVYAAANSASSFLRKAGASWPGATLKCSTRPARSISTAASGIPPTTSPEPLASHGGTHARLIVGNRHSVMQAPRHQCRSEHADKDQSRACEGGRPPKATAADKPSITAIKTILRTRLNVRPYRSVMLHIGLYRGCL